MFYVKLLPYKYSTLAFIYLNKQNYRSYIRFLLNYVLDTNAYVTLANMYGHTVLCWLIRT